MYKNVRRTQNNFHVCNVYLVKGFDSFSVWYRCKYSDLAECVLLKRFILRFLLFLRYCFTMSKYLARRIVGLTLICNACVRHNIFFDKPEIMLNCLTPKKWCINMFIFSYFIDQNNSEMWQHIWPSIEHLIWPYEG